MNEDFKKFGDPFFGWYRALTIIAKILPRFYVFLEWLVQWVSSPKAIFWVITTIVVAEYQVGQVESKFGIWFVHKRESKGYSQ